MTSLPRDTNKELPNVDDDVWLFGYGSLINKESRAITGMSGEFIFGYLKGVKRGWQQKVLWNRPEGNPGGKSNSTALGSGVDEKCETNGIFFRIPSKEIPKFDQREREYARYEFPVENARTVDGGIFLPADKPSLLCCFGEPVKKRTRVFVYINRTAETPTKQFPVCQSYVDVVIAGCLDVSFQFAVDFVKTTSPWLGGGAFVDDRGCPVYVRASQKDSARKDEIDRVLEEGLKPRSLNELRRLVDMKVLQAKS